MDKTTIRIAEYDRAKNKEKIGLIQQFGLFGDIFTRETESSIFVKKVGFNN